MAASTRADDVAPANSGNRLSGSLLRPSRIEPPLTMVGVFGVVVCRRYAAAMTLMIKPTTTTVATAAHAICRGERCPTVAAMPPARAGIAGDTLRLSLRCSASRLNGIDGKEGRTGVRAGAMPGDAASCGDGT